MLRYFLAAVMIVGVVGCGGGNKPPKPTQQQKQEMQAAHAQTVQEMGTGDAAGKQAPPAQAPQ